MGYIDGKGVMHEDNTMPASITPGDPQDNTPDMTGDISDMAARMGETPDTLTTDTPQDTPAGNHADATPKHGQHHPKWPWITAGSILAIGLLAASGGLGYGLWDANQQTNQQAAQACALSVDATHNATKQWATEHRKLQNLMTGKTASMLQNPDVLAQAANLLEQSTPPTATACGTTAATSQTALKQNLDAIADAYQATARLQTMSQQVSDELAMKQGATLDATRDNLINQANQAASLAAQATGKIEQTQPLAALNTDITAARKQAADPASSLQDLQTMSRKLTVDTQTVASDMAAYAKTQAALTQAKQEATAKTANKTTKPAASGTAGGAQPQTDDQDPSSIRNAANSFTPGQPIAQNEDPE